MTIVDRLAELFSQHGSSLYFGEAVTEAEHALQCAHQAEREGASATLIAGALLHDVGHLLHGLDESIAERGIDGKHEDGGAAFLDKHFPPAVVDPVRLHVAAKRYLCTIEPGYLERLSEASVLSFRLQGGAMSQAELEAFEAEPHHVDAVSLRRWDDAAKIVGLTVPGFDHYRQLLEGLSGLGGGD